MKVIFFLLSFLFLSAVHSETITSSIYGIDISSTPDKPHLIKLENGWVVFIEQSESDELKPLLILKDLGEVLDFIIDDHYGLVSYRKTQKMQEAPPLILSAVRGAFEPSILPDFSTAVSIFRRMRRDYQNNSQCYNRAHVWAWEEYNQSKLNSLKHFLFFTNRYIRNYRYKWWFHVSPSVLVQGLGIQILDRRYTKGPLDVKSWTDVFIFSKKDCPVVKIYNEYRDYQEQGDCYLIPVSMYFWQPRDILYRDENGYEKKEFFRREINHAFWEAF